MHIGVIGGGAIGLLITSYLRERHDVTLFVHRNGQKSAIDNHKLYRDQTRIEGNIKTIHYENMSLQQLDCVFICVKQPQLQTILGKLTDMKQDIPLIFIQNGMSHLEYVKQLKQPVFIGVVEHGALKKSDYQVIHTGKGHINIGPLYTYQPICPSVKKLHQENFPIYLTKDVHYIIHEKLVVNTVINPLTAIFNVRNGAIKTNKHLYILAEKMCREITTYLDLDYKSHFNHVLELVDKTSENKSSMLVDILHRRETEIEGILGMIIKNNESQFPYLTFAYQSIKILEEKEV